MQTRNKFGLAVIYATGSEGSDTECFVYWYPRESVREFMADAFMKLDDVLFVEPVGITEKS